jgi:hypothetical protein
VLDFDYDEQHKTGIDDDELDDLDLMLLVILYDEIELIDESHEYDELVKVILILQRQLM